MVRSHPLPEALQAAALVLLALPTPAQNAGATAAPGRPGRTPAPVPRESVVLLVADDLGIESLPLYGLDPTLPAGLTPNIDALAARGVTFQNAWANPKCSATRAALLTGRAARRTGIGTVVNSSAHSLRGTEVTLPEALRRWSPSGYRTAAFGKWHLTSSASSLACPPTEAHGFDHFAGTLQAWTQDYCNWDELVCPTGAGPVNGYMPAVIFDDAIGWIASSRRPYFALLAPQSPYEELHVPPVFLQSVVAGTGCAPCTTDPRACFLAALQAFDTKLGELLAALGPRWYRRTTIVFLGDNGSPILPGGYWPAGSGKGTLRQGGIAVPLIVAGRAVDPALRGTTTDALAQATDVYRTIASLAGIDALPPGVAEDSVDLTPLLSGSMIAPLRTTIVAEKFKTNAAAPPYPEHKAAIRDAVHKLIYNYETGNRIGFYDLSVDPRETQNLLLPTPPPPGTPAGDALLALEAQLIAALGS